MILRYDVAHCGGLFATYVPATDSGGLELARLLSAANLKIMDLPRKQKKPDWFREREKDCLTKYEFRCHHETALELWIPCCFYWEHTLFGWDDVKTERHFCGTPMVSGDGGEALNPAGFAEARRRLRCYERSEEYEGTLLLEREGEKPVDETTD